MARGGKRYKQITISLPKSLYSVIEGICIKDKGKMNRLIKRILEKEIEKSTVKELKALIESSETEISDSDRETEKNEEVNPS